MVNSGIIAAAVLMLNPAIGERRADRIADAIAFVTDDASKASAMVVTAHSEASFRWNVETCSLRGLGGLGLWGLGRGWGSEERRCGPIAVQARLAAQALEPIDDPVAMFSGFLARASHDREVQQRASLFWITKARIELAACL